MSVASCAALTVSQVGGAYLESMASFLERWWWLLGVLGGLLLPLPWSLRLLSILLAAAVLAFLLWWEYLWGMAVRVCVCVCSGSSGTITLLPAGPKPNGEGRSVGQLENSVSTVWLRPCVRALWETAEAVVEAVADKRAFLLGTICFPSAHGYSMFPQCSWLQLKALTQKDDSRTFENVGPSLNVRELSVMWNVPRCWLLFGWFSTLNRQHSLSPRESGL